VYIVGHHSQRDKLKELLQNNQLAQSLLFTGTDGIGKKKVAEELCCMLLCERLQFESADLPCLQCNACRSFLTKNHPDAYLLDCQDRENSNTAAIRELLFDLHLSSFSGSNRVVLFDNADAMPIQAANALLKSFEEPRPGLYFVLITSNRSRLPKTLLSRCQTWFFNPLSSEDIHTILSNTDDADLQEQLGEMTIDIQALSRIADGSMQNVCHLIGHEEFLDEVRSALGKAKKGALDSVSDICRSWSRDKDALRVRLQLIRLLARKLMIESVDFQEKSRWSQLLSSAVQAEPLIFDRNINAGYLLELMFLQLGDSDGVPSLSHPSSISQIVT
jgi:DNA polymerase-3 subunit delta'